MEERRQRSETEMNVLGLARASIRPSEKTVYFYRVAGIDSLDEVLQLVERFDSREAISGEILQELLQKAIERTEFAS
jgi:hypothetical protein